MLVAASEICRKLSKYAKYLFLRKMFWAPGSGAPGSRDRGPKTWDPVPGMRTTGAGTGVPDPGPGTPVAGPGIRVPGIWGG